ncbi:MAG: Gfo/Idh/MocA family protein [Armatimonadota bacterium]|jgi:UDP-N-acetyl-2-amino-2-deoxyglucuronate dehydrogenase
MKEYGFGVVGCGVISSVHFKALQMVERANLIATCDVVEERAQKAADEYGAEAVYTDFHDLLARDDIDVVHVTTPSSHHHVVSIAASEAGKHSFVTKPIDITLDKIDAMIEAAEANGVKLAAAHQFRSYDSYRQLKRAIEEGRLGELYYGNAFVPWWREQSYYTDRWQGTWEHDGGGALMNQSVHWVDLLVWMMGDVAEVCGYADTKAHEMETEDIGTAAVLFKSGAHGVIQGTTLTYKGMNSRLEVHGSKGNVVIEADRITHWDVEGEESLADADVADDETSAADPMAGLGDAVGAHRFQVEALLDWIEGTGEPFVTGPDARRPVEVNLAIYASQRTGEKVRLPLEVGAEVGF